MRRKNAFVVKCIVLLRRTASLKSLTKQDLMTTCSKRSGPGNPTKYKFTKCMHIEVRKTYNVYIHMYVYNFFLTTDLFFRQ